MAAWCVNTSAIRRLLKYCWCPKLGLLLYFLPHGLQLWLGLLANQPYVLGAESQLWSLTKRQTQFFEEHLFLYRHTVRVLHRGIAPTLSLAADVPNHRRPDSAIQLPLLHRYGCWHHDKFVLHHADQRACADQGVFLDRQDASEDSDECNWRLM